MGFAAAFGACFAAKPGQRVVALEGDGSFQMTAQELSSMSRYNCPAIIFVVNSKGYTAERLIHDGPFNDIANWRYHRLAAAFGGVGLGCAYRGDLEQALIQAEAHTGPGPLLIEIHVDPWDASEAFTLMSETSAEPLMVHTIAATEDEPGGSLAYPWYIVSPVHACLYFSFIDRVISLLIDPIRADLQISDTQFSLLHGLAFAMLYAVAGIPIARLADSRSRPAIIA